MTQLKPPNPGSDDAVEQGCTCPVLDNARGKGGARGAGTFWVSVGCPLHGKNIKEKTDGE